MSTLSSAQESESEGETLYTETESDEDSLEHDSDVDFINDSTESECDEIEVTKKAIPEKNALRVGYPTTCTIGYRSAHAKELGKRARADLGSCTS